MGRPLVYKATDYQRHLWKYHKLTDDSAEASEREGRNRYEAFSDFAEEVYHRMYSDIPERIEDPAPGSEVFVRMHDLMDDIPEMENFREKCQGNERWAGIGTAAVIDTLLDKVEPPEEQVKDLRSDEDVKGYMERLVENADDEGKREGLQEMLDEQMDPNNPEGFPARQKRAQDAADMIDETDVRNSFRAAIAKASGLIEEEESLLDAFSVGMDKHSGRKARMNAHKKLANIIAGNERLKQIAQLAGRLRRIAMEQQRQKPQKGTDEVTGVEFGADLRKMVPSEALWADEEVDAVFANKLHERSLAQFELSKTPKKEQGPIVMLVDSSGSMAWGDADIWAAAVCLAFFGIAYEQKRAFALIHFGSKTLRKDTFVDVSRVDKEEMLEAISFFAADGGTNFMEPLADGVKVIRDTGAFEDADIIMVTDGCANVNDQFMDIWNKAKAELGFSCYSVLVGASPQADTNEKFSDEVVHLADAIKEDTAMHKFFQAV